MLSEVTVMKYELNFFFEWGADCASIWCKNQKSFDKFGAGPISFDNLGLSDSLKSLLLELGEEYQTALDWDTPQNPSPWNNEHKESFKVRSKIAYQKLVEELGEDYIVNYCVEVYD